MAVVGQSLSTCQGERMVVVLLTLTSLSALAGLALPVAGGLLGAGRGPGSCSAPPFRADSLAWPAGCPAYAEVGIDILLYYCIIILYLLSIVLLGVWILPQQGGLGESNILP